VSRQYRFIASRNTRNVSRRCPPSLKLKEYSREYVFHSIDNQADDEPEESGIGSPLPISSDIYEVACQTPLPAPLLCEWIFLTQRDRDSLSSVEDGSCRLGCQRHPEITEEAVETDIPDLVPTVDQQTHASEQYFDMERKG